MSTETNDQRDLLNESFKQAALPLIKFINENFNPHTTVIVTCTNAELCVGEITTGDVLDFVKD